MSIQFKFINVFIRTPIPIVKYIVKYIVYVWYDDNPMKKKKNLKKVRIAKLYYIRRYNFLYCMYLPSLLVHQLRQNWPSTSVFAIYGWKSNSERVLNTCRRLPGAVTISDLFSKTLHNTFFLFFFSLKTTAFSGNHYYYH